MPDVDVDSLRVEYVAATNDVESAIVEAFECVFNQKGIGLYDDFVRLGGDSLIAVKLLSYLGDYNISAADVLSLRTPYAIANNVKNYSFDLDLYSLESGCPLSEPQLNVYLDIVANDKKDSYIIPLFMNISKKYDIGVIVDALNRMLEVHPVLGMCVSDEFDVPYLVKGSEPEVLVKSDVDDVFINEFLIKSFDLYDSLCRFLVIENDDNYMLYGVFHHIIFDALSDGVFKRDLQNSMLADSDDVGFLLDSIGADGPGHVNISLDLDYDLFNSFLRSHGISENILFSSVFAYTLSRFVGGEKVLFNIIDNGRDRFQNYDSIGMFVNTLPLLVDCTNQNVDSFLDYMSDMVYGVMKYNFYPFRFLANKYDINSNIIFQFIPEWMLI